MTVNNLQDFDVVVGLLFFPERTAHGIEDIVVPPTQRFTLASRETRVFGDVLGTVMGLDNAKGLLLITCNPDILQIDPPGEDDLAVVATMRTYDVSSPVGTYGQTIPANFFVVNYSEQPSFITGAVNDGNFRSNLGLFNQSLGEVTIHFRIRSAGGAVVAEGTKTLGSLWTQQWSFNSLGVGSVQGPLTVDLWLDPDDAGPPCSDLDQGGVAFFAYVSKVDSRTQDAEFIYAAPAWVAENECD